MRMNKIKQEAQTDDDFKWESNFQSQEEENEEEEEEEEDKEEEWLTLTSGRWRDNLSLSW